MAGGGVVTRRRRALLLIGLALLLGGLAASDVARREAAIARQLGPDTPVVVARGDLPAGSRLTTQRLAVRRVPARYAPAAAARAPGELLGQRVAVPVASGGYLSTNDLAGAGGAAPPGAPVRAGERVADVVASGPPALVQPGGHVDVLVTRESDHGDGGSTTLALEDVEVLAASAAPEGAGASSSQSPGPRVSASLRVTVKQAVYLAAAQAFAREIRLLPRAAGDDRHGSAGTEIGAGLA
jgi:pilus assembly protein CpaB